MNLATLLHLAASDRALKIYGAVGLIVAGEIARRAFLRERLVWGRQHGFHFTIPGAGAGGQELALSTASWIVVNQGSVAAEEVELHLPAPPAHFQLWPLTNYSVATMADGHVVITVPNIPPKTYITLEAINSVAGAPGVGIPAPVVFRVKSKAREGLPREMIPYVKYPQWLRYVVRLLITIGLGAIAFGGLSLVF